MYELLWRPVGVERPDDVVLVSSRASANRWRGLASAQDFNDLQRTQQSFAAVAAFTSFGQPLTAASVSEVVDIEAVTGRFFDVVRCSALAGRVLHPADQTRARAGGRAGRTVLATSPGCRPGIVGRAVRIGSQSFEVVGVAPASFLGLAPADRGAPTRGCRSRAWRRRATRCWRPRSRSPSARDRRPARAGRTIDDQRGGDARRSVPRWTATTRSRCRVRPTNRECRPGGSGRPFPSAIESRSPASGSTC